MILVFIIAANICSVQTDENAWNSNDSIREMTLLGLGVFDVMQTRWALQNSDDTVIYTEGNWVLGKNPSQARLYGTLLSAVVLHYVVAKNLPKDWRVAFQVITITIESTIIVSNITTVGGIRLSF